MEKYYTISTEKEILDSYKLAEMIKKDNWIDETTIIVTCSPDYSSIVSQIVNHQLSPANNNELHGQMFLEMPYPTMSQVWNSESGEWEMFDKYLSSWFLKLDKNNKYLFLDSGTLRGKNFSKIKTLARGRIDFKLGTLYLEEQSIVTPDYFVEKFSSEEKGGLLFQWENPLNPNWNY